MRAQVRAGRRCAAIYGLVGCGVCASPIRSLALLRSDFRGSADRLGPPTAFHCHILLKPGRASDGSRVCAQGRSSEASGAWHMREENVRRRLAHIDGGEGGCPQQAPGPEPLFTSFSSLKHVCVSRWRAGAPSQRHFDRRLEAAGDRLGCAAGRLQEGRAGATSGHVASVSRPRSPDVATWLRLRQLSTRTHAQTLCDETCVYEYVAPPPWLRMHRTIAGQRHRKAQTRVGKSARHCATVPRPTVRSLAVICLVALPLVTSCRDGAPALGRRSRSFTVGVGCRSGGCRQSSCALVGRVQSAGRAAWVHRGERRIGGQVARPGKFAWS